MIEKIKNIRVEEVGKNTWKDARDNVYIVNKDKTAFLKMDSRQANIYSILKMRLMLAGLIAFFFDYYFNNIWEGLVVGAIAYALMEAYYRFRLLPQFPTVGKITNPEDIKVERFARFKKSNRKELLKGLAMGAIFDALLITNFISMKYSLASLFDFSSFKEVSTIWLYVIIIVMVTGLVFTYIVFFIKNKDVK